MSDVYELDLTNLNPKPAKIKMGDPSNPKEVTMKPPKMSTLVVIQQYGGLIDGTSDKVTAEQAERAETALKQEIYKLSPEMKEFELSNAQIMSLCNLIMDMAMPEQTKELERHGIKIEKDDEKKA